MLVNRRCFLRSSVSRAAASITGAPNKERFARNIMDIVGHMGERYGEKIRAWWFDTDEQVFHSARACNEHMTPMTFNVGVYQDGTLAPDSVEPLYQLDAALKKEGEL